MNKTQLAAIFNLWALRYSENPETFWDKILDENGKPVQDYGDACAEYFSQLSEEINP